MWTLWKLPEQKLDPSKGARWNRKLSNVFPDDETLWHCVYLVGSKQDLIGYRLPRLYVGESSQPKQRFVDHSNAGVDRHDRKLFRLINSKGWTFEENCLVIHFGLQEDCLFFEAALRPREDMGLNRKAGGRKRHRWDERLSLREAHAFAESQLPYIIPR